VNWLPAQNNVKITTVDFITQRKPHSVRDLEKIQCPILLLHGGSDIAYPVEFTEEFESLLREASVDVDMQVIEGAPHFVSITHPEKYATPSCLFSYFVNSNSPSALKSEPYAL